MVSQIRLDLQTMYHHTTRSSVNVVWGSELWRQEEGFYFACTIGQDIGLIVYVILCNYALANIVRWRELVRRYAKLQQKTATQFCFN